MKSICAWALLMGVSGLASARPIVIEESATLANPERGFVNGNLLMQATDSSHTAGIGGLMTSKAAAQFDDYLAYQP